MPGKKTFIKAIKLGQTPKKRSGGAAGKPKSTPVKNKKKKRRGCPYCY